jgi:hypothetical protein
MLALQLGHKVMGKLSGFKEFDKLRGPGKNELMLIRNHAQELIDTMGDLPLRTIDSYLITGLLSAGEVNLAVVFLFQVIDLRESGNKLAMIEAVNTDNLRCVLRILLIIISIELAIR